MPKCWSSTSPPDFHVVPRPDKEVHHDKIAVVFDSGCGHILRMAQAVAEGAGAEPIAIDRSA
jgi:hypothetical protein